MPDREDWNSNIIQEFRTNEGKVGGPFDGAPILLLHTTGARSGRERINPMMYLADGDRLVVFASKGGAPTNPDVEIEVGTERRTVRARVAEGEEHDRLYAEQSKRYPQFAKYQEGTDRTIPVVILEAA